MVTRLVQKHLFKDTLEFELIDDTVNIHCKSLFKADESLTVMLAVLNPEPVISKSRLEFTSRVNNEPLMSLYLAKPNANEFNAFVNLVKQRAQDEYNKFAGMKSAAPLGNSFEEPPEFEDSNGSVSARQTAPVSAEGVENAIRMLTEYLDSAELSSFLAALEALRTDPQNQACLSRVATEFEALGSNQGAVLTYAPYISILLSDDPFADL